MQLDYSKAERYSLRLDTDVKRVRTGAGLAVNSQNIFFPDVLTTQQNSDFLTVKQRLSTVKRLTDRKVLIGEVSYQYASLPQNVIANSRRYAGFWGLDSSYRTLNQTATLQQRDVQAVVRYKGSRRETFFSATAGVHDQYSQARSTGLLSADSPRVAAHLDSLRNGLTYGLQTFFGDGSYVTRNRKWLASIGGNVQYVRQRVGDGVLGGQTTANTLLLNPTVAAGLDLGPQERLLLVLAHSQTVAPVNQLLNGYLLADYRTLVRGTTLPNLIRSDAAVLNYHNLNFTRLRTYQAALSVVRERNAYVYDIGISPTLTLLTAKPFDGYIYQYKGSAEGHYFVPALTAQLHADLSVNRADLVATQGTDVQRNTLTTTEFGLAGVTAFDGPVNLEVGSRQVITSLNAGQRELNGLTRTILVKPRVILKANPAKTIHFRAVNEYVYWQTGGNRKAFWLVDALCQYLPDKKPYSVEFSINNLLNVNTINATQFTGNYLIAQRSYLLQPRYVSVRFDWHF